LQANSAFGWRKPSCANQTYWASNFTTTLSHAQDWPIRYQSGQCQALC